MKVSFVVPVYNVEKYLRQCVESILCQTYQDFELILVDDGSKDTSPQLCDQLAIEDSRVKVIHKQNGGLSDARNAGIAVAKGDYLIFIDSDDFWMDKDDLRKLMGVAMQHKECDFIGFNCSYYYPSKGSFRPWSPIGEELQMPISGSRALCLLSSSGTMPMSAWLKLISRKFLVENNVFFKVGQLGEDIPWFINLLEKASSCLFVNNYIYAYRQNVSGSITASGGERSFDNLLDIIKNELTLLDKRTFEDDAKDALRSFLAYELSILISTVNTLPKSRRKTMRKELKNMCWLLGYTINPKVKMVSTVYRIGGFRITELLLRCYDWYRERRN